MSENDAFLSSLGEARSDIDRQVQNTIREAQRQRDVALRQTAQIPGAVQAATSNAQTQATGTLDRASARGQELGLAGLGARALQPSYQEVSGRMADVNSVYGTAAQSLSQGFQEQALQREGQVNMISQQLLADNQMQRAAAVSQMQQAAAQRAHEQAMQQQQFQQQQQLLESGATAQAEAQRRNQIQQTLASLIDPTGQGIDYRAAQGIADFYGMSLQDLLADYAGPGVPLTGVPAPIQSIGQNQVTRAGSKYLL